MFIIIALARAIQLFLIIYTGLAIFFIISLILMHIGLWKTFKKMGLPGWESLLIGHNFARLFEKADLPKQYLFFYYIPWIGWIGANIYMGINLMKKFNKGIGMGIVLGVFPNIAFLIVGFSKNFIYQSEKLEAKTE